MLQSFPDAFWSYVRIRVLIASTSKQQVSSDRHLGLLRMVHEEATCSTSGWLTPNWLCRSCMRAAHRRLTLCPTLGTPPTKVLPIGLRLKSSTALAKITLQHSSQPKQALSRGIMLSKVSHLLALVSFRDRGLYEQQEGQFRKEATEWPPLFPNPKP